ncbi:hypothetical protein FACS1894167_07310 [Synergistales bacterium]|nr:hypothetical protein FACS1894167_07310 [Synergistales bacterium]
MLIGYFDGASRGNPGKAGAGACIVSGKALVWECAEYLGIKTNNEAEYAALALLLAEARRRGVTEIEARGDSKLVVSQMKGEYKAKTPHIAVLRDEARRLAEGMKVKFTWIPREENKQADALSNKAIDDEVKPVAENPPAPKKDAPGQNTKKLALRETIEAREREWLSAAAALASKSKGRLRDEPECPIRTVFQRDRDRIIHSKSFRRLKHKTQVLFLPESDHTRTRLTHTLEVAQIARTIARALRLNEDLTEAIALGHDLGHTPFGHAGERALRAVAAEHGLPPFHHSYQSLRVVDVLERGGHGLNLTWEVRMGIVQHSKGQVDVKDGFALARPSSTEAWVVRVSDSIAYLNHDLGDALGSKLISVSDVPEGVLAVLGRTHSKRINSLVSDVIERSGETIAFSEPILEQAEALRRFLFERVYLNDAIKAEEPKIERIIRALFENALRGGLTPREAADTVSGMTDRYAVNMFRNMKG